MLSEDFKLMFEKDNMDMGSLTLSSPQTVKPDKITRQQLQVAKVPHYSFSLPAGISCPYATECRSRSIATGGFSDTGKVSSKVKDGTMCKFRCFAVSGESQYPDVRKMRYDNFTKLTGLDPDKHFPSDELRNKYGINQGNANTRDKLDDLMTLVKLPATKLGDALGDKTHSMHNTDRIKALLTDMIIINKQKIMSTGPKYKGKGVLRVHVSGDFYSQAYFDAWMLTAKDTPDIIFYSYTKSLPYWETAKKAGTIPENYKLIASYGGSKDELIAENRFKFAAVCFSKNEAKLFPSLSVHKTIIEDGKTKPNPKYKMLNTSFPLVDKTIDGVQIRKYVYDSNGSPVSKTGIPICEEIRAIFDTDNDIEKFGISGSDFPAYGTDAPFALLLHGTQPSNSDAAKNISEIKKAAKAEILQARVNFFLDTTDMTPTEAHIEVAMREYVYKNMVDDKINSSPNRATKTPYDINERKKLLIKKIAKYLYAEDKNITDNKPISSKEADLFIPQANEEFDLRIDPVTDWVNSAT